MRTGSFETDTKRAEKRLKEMQKTAERAGAAIGLAVVGGATAAVVAFDQLNKSTADFQDVAETIGDSAENVASMGIALATAGVGVDSFATASIKLSKSLVGVDDESKAVGAALKFLNINIEEFKRLSPVQQYEAVARALGQVADKQTQVQLATTLFGKAGAEQLKVMNALAAEGGRQVVLTQEQIERADAYADAQARNMAVLKLYAQAIAVELLPAYNDLVGAGLEVIESLFGVDRATKQLGKNEGIREFGDNVAKAFAFVVDQVDLVSRLFELAGKGIAGTLATQNALLRGELKEAVNIAREAQRDINETIDRETFGDKLRKRINARNVAEQNAASYSNEGRLPTPTGQKFGGVPDKPPKEKTSEAEKYAEQLRNQLQTTQELTALEKLWDDVGRGRLGTLTVSQMVVLDGLASQIDAQRELTEARKADNDALTESNRKVQQNYERAQQLAESVETPMERLRSALKAINEEAEKNPFISQETSLRRTEQAWLDYSEAVTKATEKNNTFASQAANNIQDALGATVEQTLRGNFENIEKLWLDMLIRLSAQAIAADIGGKLFGEQFGKTGQIGGWAGQLLQMFGSGSGGNTVGAVQSYGFIDGYADGGRPPVGVASLVGERGPELFVPNTAGRVIPNEMLGGGGDVQIINPPGMPLRARVEEKRESNKNVKRVVLSAMIEDANAGGSGITTISRKLGAPRQLMRRGR